MDKEQEIKEFVEKEVLDLLNRKIKIQINKDMNNPFRKDKYIEIIFSGHCLGESSGYREFLYTDDFIENGYKCLLAKRILNNLIGLIVDKRIHE
ncbi:MAG: hypothetical protein ACRCVJ_18645 [Clostridium sp.]|uniref:hypothetical protein n=1 Tax=Clostridium sp. TaxID=1506 RepID=UPI003F34DC3B